MLKVDELSFSYESRKVLSEVSFTCDAGQQTAIIGESGSGKSTLLKLIYGQYDLNHGTISLDGKPILGPKHNLIPGDESVKYLAQDFGLMPYSTAAENVGQFLSNTNKQHKRKRIAELLEIVDMSDYGDVKPKHLSGGQQQRIALAKALALEPKLLLLDEPFSQIDVIRANPLRRNIYNYLREKNIACLIATHDAADVLPFADRVLVLKDGEVAAQGHPTSVYENPTSKYVASLFDDINEIPGHFFQTGIDENVLIYPHELQISDGGLRAAVTKSYYHGSFWRIEARYAGGFLLFDNTESILPGSVVMLRYKTKKALENQGSSSN